MRQNRMAKILGIHETVFSRIVNGFRTPTESTRLRIAALLQSDAEWLFAEEPQAAGSPDLEPVLDANSRLFAGGQR